MPFITEEIYQEYFRKFEKEKSIHVSRWPEYGGDWIEKWNDKKVISHANKLTLFSDLLTKVRTEKTNSHKSMNAECIITLSATHKKDLGEKLEDFKNVTNAKEIKTGKFNVKFV
jgi:valyl-tRNA synthetase